MSNSLTTMALIRNSILNIGCCRWFVILILGLGATFEIADADTLDVFPLRKGLEYTYVYQDSLDFTSSYIHYNYKDSGLVSYKIIDSVELGDTVVQWIILETRNLFHTSYTGGLNSIIADSAVRYLYESKLQPHELKCESFFWNFPITNGPDNRETTDVVFRYKETSPCLLFHESYCAFSPIQIFHDSLWFQVDSGLSQWTWKHCLDWMDWGGFSVGKARLVSLVIVPVDEILPSTAKTGLISNYPNPFNESTTISYNLSITSPVRLTIYDLTGRVLFRDEGIKSVGTHHVSFSGTGLSSGVFLIRLQTPIIEQMEKMVYLR